MCSNQITNLDDFWPMFSASNIYLFIYLFIGERTLDKNNVNKAVTLQLDNTIGS